MTGVWYEGPRKKEARHTSEMGEKAQMNVRITKLTEIM